MLQKTFFLLFFCAGIERSDRWRGLREDCFSPVSGIEAKIAVLDQLVNVELKNGAHSTLEEFQVETEKRLSVVVDDYNFDGLQDFSISHLDDGMGTCKIFRIYVFSVEAGNSKSCRQSAVMNL